MLKKLSLCLFIFLSFWTEAQILSLPPRDVNALEGSEVVTAIWSLPLYDREVFIKNEVLAGNVPDFQRNMIAVTDSALIGGAYKFITYFVIPDYLALGSDTNYFLCPMTPILAQQLADSMDCLLPTRKMVDNIWEHAGVKMTPESIPPGPNMITVPVFNDHNNMVKTQRSAFVQALGTLVSGDKKDVVISNLIYTSPSPPRVVIYGWHYQNGINIQPLYAGHVNTYADYSHGIRMVQDQCWVDGVPMLASSVLSDATLYPLLSDEGVMTQPYYPDTSGVSNPSPPATPKEFVVLNESSDAVRLKIANDPNTGSYKVYTSTDGLTFALQGSYATSDIVISGLTSDQIVYVRIAATNTGGTSNQSEVLAAVPSAVSDTVLIVNGFDRNSAGNTKNFIRQHGQSLMDYGAGFSSATNDAVISNMVNLQNYRVVDYILGEESTADETFSLQEQLLIMDYLDQGGMLFVSGAEIGWDLDHLGTSADQQFYSAYLKAEYVYDAPGDMASTYYEFEDEPAGIFEGFGNAFYDNGTNGTYNVDYPDVINPVNGAMNGLYYTGLTSQYAGIYFEGLFPNATEKGKLVYLGFPFETVYPENGRHQLMNMVMTFFEDEPVVIDTTGSALPENEMQVTVYPNPFSELLIIESEYQVDYQIMDVNGGLIFAGELPPGKSLKDMGDLPAGIYFLRVFNQYKSNVFRLMKE